MKFRVLIEPEAEKDIERLDSSIRERVLKKIHWLSEHPELLGRKSLQNLPFDLKGLNSYTVGDWRVLYWLYSSQQTIKIYGVKHRSEVYKKLR